MGISEIMNMLKEYLLLGVIVVLLTAIIFAVGYFVVYKKICKGKKQMGKKTAIIGAIFICYMVVVMGATLLGRYGMWIPPEYISVLRRFQLFSSYWEAWNEFSFTEWRNLILNILLFVPMGFLLPLLSDKFGKFWRTYLMGLCITVFIETVQLVTGRGVFEADDILNNLFGTMIGYGVYKIVAYIVDKVKLRETKIRPVLLAQIPLLVVIIAFASIFCVYNHQEYGNLRSSYSIKVSMKNAKISSEIELSDEKIKQEVYQYKRLSRKEAATKAKKFFETIGDIIDESQTKFYDDTVVCYSEKGQSVWIDYAGGTLQYIDFSQGFDEEDKEIEKADNAEAEEIKKALEKLGIEVPEGAEFTAGENGNYTFTANQIVDGDVMYDGILHCEYNANHKITSVENHIVVYTSYKMVTLRSKKEALDDIKAGKFKAYIDSTGIHNVQIKDVTVGYEMDTKGFYQPIYEFHVIRDDLEDTIVVAAMDK